MDRTEISQKKYKTAKLLLKPVEKSQKKNIM